MKFLVKKSVSESADLLNWGFGFSRDEIDDNVQVRNQTRSGFDVRYGDGGGGAYDGKGIGYTSVSTPSGTGPMQRPALSANPPSTSLMKSTSMPQRAIRTSAAGSPKCTTTQRASGPRCETGRRSWCGPRGC